MPQRPIRHLGAVLRIDEPRIRLWVSGLTPADGVDIEIPSGMPEQLRRRGIGFDVTGVDTVDDLPDGVYTPQPGANEPRDRRLHPGHPYGVAVADTETSAAACQAIIDSRGRSSGCVFAPALDAPAGLYPRGEAACGVDLYTYPQLCDAAGTDHTHDTLRRLLGAHPTGSAILCEKALDELGWLVDADPYDRDVYG